VIKSVLGLKIFHILIQKLRVSHNYLQSLIGLYICLCLSPI